MRLEYRLLWKISLLLILLGIFCPHTLVTANENLNRNAEELFSLGIQAERQDKNADAEKIYEQCLRLAKENSLSRLESPVLHRLAILKAKEQKITESETYFREALQHDRENTALLCDFAKLYSDQKKYADAETILKNALLIAPDHRRILFNLGFVIVLQPNRQTEGLRYLKLAIGEVAAYQELAKIYRQQGNNGQAEFAEQRAAILEKSRASAESVDSMTSPTVPMDAQTKKELIQHVKEELLRLETAEIAAATQTATIKTITPIPEPLSTEPLPTEPLPTQPSPTQPAHDPFLAAESFNIDNTDNIDEKNKIKDPTVQAFPLTETNPVSRSPLSAHPEKIETSPTMVELPKVLDPSLTISEPPQVIKILKPQPLTPEPLPNETIKTFPQHVQSHQKTNEIRTLPTTDFRISNSTEGDPDIPQQTEVHALTIVPLEDAATNKSIPEYTAISIRKITLTENTSGYSRLEEKKTPPPIKAENEEKIPVSRFRDSVSPGDAATISLSFNKTKTQQTPQNETPDKTNPNFSARSHLEQPINLITLNSRRSTVQQPNAPIPAFGSSEKRRREEEQQVKSSSNVLADQNRFGVENGSVQNDSSGSSQRSSKSILRPGAGKIGIPEELDSYVYVDPEKLKNQENSSTPSNASEPSELAKEEPKPVLATKSISESFSLMRPMPGKLAGRVTNPSPQITAAPPIKTGISNETLTKTLTETTEMVRLPNEKTPHLEIPATRNIVAQNQPIIEKIEKIEKIDEIEKIETIEEKVSMKADPVETNPAETEIDKRTDMQFSSLQAPTVLKFEIASATKSDESDKLDKLDESNNSNKLNKLNKNIRSESVADTFQPPTVL
ncbi:MAG: hypothetical protein LBQ50_02290, partial [Planctomycetaceae bacterium]|nr:hypothetical protein [Planctomycetaceae bacterium]